MNTKRLYVLTAVNNPGTSLYQKLFLAFLVIALLFASLPVSSVLAASAGNQGSAATNKDLEQAWSNKLRNLRAESLFFTQARFFPADFEESSDLARAWDLLHKHGFALRQANTVVLNHAGFDLKGRVTDEEQAAESVRDLAEALRIMRGVRTKIAEAGYKVHRFRQSAVG